MTAWNGAGRHRDRKSTRLNSSHITISYAVFCLKKNKNRPGGTPFRSEDGQRSGRRRAALPRHTEVQTLRCARPSRRARTTRGDCLFFFNDTATTEIYTLSLHDALPI